MLLDRSAESKPLSKINILNRIKAVSEVWYSSF